MTQLSAYYLALLSSYVIGGIPTGYIVAYLVGGINILEHGSGNIGATNVARVLGRRRYFALILATDAAKSLMTLLFCRFVLSYSQPALIGIAAAVLLGNGFSLFLGLRGGKGVSTAAGVLLYFLPLSAVSLYVSLWVVCKMLFRRVDIASMTAAVVGSLLVVYFWNIQPPLSWLLIGMGIWIVMRHHRNIAWIIRGTHS